MALEIHKLKNGKHHCENNVHLVRAPTWRRVIRMQQKVHASKAHQNPVVRAILENVEEGHRVIRKPVDEQSL